MKKIIFFYDSLKSTEYFKPNFWINLTVLISPTYRLDLKTNERDERERQRQRYTRQRQALTRQTETVKETDRSFCPAEEVRLA